VRKAILYGGIALLLLAIAAGIALRFYVQGLGPRARERVIHALEDRFDADVDLKSLELSIYPPKVVGEGLTIRHKQWPDPHPLIRIRRFNAETDFFTLIDRRNEVNLIRLEGLEIHVPPRGRSTLGESFEDNHEVASSETGTDTAHLQFSIQTIVADGTLLEIEPKVQGKDPLQFEIQKLTLHSVAPGQAMTFKAKLTNAKPPGLIDTDGRFGPWQRDDPRATAVSGNYTFQNADLGVFKGISGILSSSGNYKGVLQHIEVDGSTDTPKFALKRGGDPVHLTTKFHSVVNGTDGDTILNPVDARFLRSEFLCKGGVVKKPGEHGKTVSLDAVTTRARMEDILRLVIGSDKPILTGDVNFKSKILIPPGREDVMDKLRLDGQFAVTEAQFTSPDVERRLRTLSDRARGISKSEEAQQPPRPAVASNFRGRFKLDDGVTSFSQLSFNVPGAQILLKGKYDLRSGQIDMDGQFRMQGTLSQTQSGIKEWLLKPLDPFFKKDGAGFQVPISITGTRAHPEIGTEIFHKHFTIH
jgi:hypothetical protein